MFASHTKAINMLQKANNEWGALIKNENNAQESKYHTKVLLNLAKWLQVTGQVIVDHSVFKLGLGRAYSNFESLSVSYSTKPDGKSFLLFRSLHGLLVLRRQES